MKKFLLLFLCLAVFASCSNDDDVTTGTDPIVGTWAIVQMTPSLISFNDCEQESTLTFNEDNTGEGTFYLEQAGCEAETSTGTWTNRGNSAYTIEVPVLGELDGTANFTGDDRFTFTTQLGVLSFERR